MLDDHPPAGSSSVGDLEARVGDASSGEPRTPGRLYALKSADTFVVADSHGDIVGDGDGLFHRDTRVLSCLRISLGGKSPSLLAAHLSRDNVLFTAHMANRPLPPLGEQSLPEGVIHIERQRLIHDGRLFERITLTNFAARGTTIPLEIAFGADFRDIFEVRGMMRPARGTIAPPRLDGNTVTLSYKGLDATVRTSALSFSPTPQSLTGTSARFTITLAREEIRSLYIEVGTSVAHPSRARYRRACARARWDMRQLLREGATVRSSNPVFTNWMEKSRADLALLTTQFPTGPYPCAGIPWFSTPFGRDGIITALQMLWLDPSLARGVLSYLAAHQATEYSAFRDAAPGKIMHETRSGEMADLGEVPFGLYYGGVDSTPLFVMLAGAYADRTGDFALIDRLWSNLVAAMGWIETSGDSNGDGFVDYARGAETGLSNQGWKDSNDSVFHADGSDPVGPIALVEVQGYVHAAYQAMARLAGRRGDGDAAAAWREKADALRERIEQKFWIADKGFYALAIDGAGRACTPRTSNVGHLLFTGVPAPERAAQVTGDLLTPKFLNGFGVRTLATGEARFNPMSYHNGSIWPHDTALALAGMARYGERDGVVRLMDDLFDAAVQFDLRLPELFCGFPRRGAGDAPVGYPVACMPQAWASGAAFMALQACLGVTIDHRFGVRIERPRLPAGVDELVIRNIAIGGRRVTLTFQRVGAGVVAYSDQHFGGAVPIAGTDRAA